MQCVTVKVSRAEDAAHDATLAFNEKPNGWAAVRTRELEYLREVERRARAFAESVDWRVDVVTTPENRNTSPEDYEDRYW